MTPKCWLEAVLSFFYPEVCQLCGSRRATWHDGYVCIACWSRFRFIEPPYCRRCGLPYEGDMTTTFECANCREMELHFSHARAAVAVNPPILEVIHRYKYQRALWFEPVLTDLLVRAAAPELAQGTWDLIVPVPLHPAKKNEREFNQAERLGAGLSAATGIPMNRKLVKRVLPTRTQTRLSRRDRATNVQRAFCGRARQKLAGQRVVLVDDVLTTGATTSACARALKHLGAAEVCVWTVARGL
jgi:competence protein ComFC